MAKDAGRPYFQHSIAQLEELFEQAGSDVRTLRILDHELSFRATDRARRLRARVADAVAGLSLRVVNAADSPGVPRTDRQASVVALPREKAGGQRRSQEVPVTAAPSSSIPPVLDLGDLPSIQIPKDPNRPEGILATWTALEALSPQTFRRPEDLAGGDRRCVASLTDGPLPWERGERSRPKRRLYYQVALGAIAMDKATDRLVKAFGEDEERPSRAREKAVLGMVLVDKDGVALEENGVAVSSFARALPLALDLKLGALGAWPKVEQTIIDKLTDILRRVDDDGKPLPLDHEVIVKAHRWLDAQFGLPEELVEPPDFALRVYHPYRAKNPPEASLLNSFFLGDLARGGALIGDGAAPAGLRRYLGAETPKDIHDLLTDRVTLEQAVAPNMIPAARWPSAGGHPLVLLQQAAVNLARAELADGEGIIAINGPPGTGKTTLLRDVVAACVLDRALAMAAFDDPESAFTPSGSKIAVGEKAFFHLYSLAPTLKGHEVLVASSNNKAVENVSRELPAAKAVGRNIDELGYFRTVSDLVHAPREDPDEDGEDEDAAPEPLATWGLIAAVLGNAKTGRLLCERSGGMTTGVSGSI